ncbi:MAG: phosphotransferase, partial [Planctomycetes bacterium]|nr:phosphotransferase [Planctomycetota bacterium]
MDFRVPDQLAALRDPATWPVAPRDAAEPCVLQTHVSVVVLCGDRAFKLKKALALPFVDQSSAAKRHAACLTELRLNRRLCPSVYLAVLPLRRTPVGLRLGAAAPHGGETVDHAVVMQRLPAARMLDVLLARDAVHAAEIAALARTVAAFHRAQARRADDAVRAAGAPARLLALARANFTETMPLAGSVFDRELHAVLADRLEAALPALEERLARRAREGRIVDGHGDLHARNVCLTEPPVIYDALEFDAGMRCGDVATDLAFLAMDLRYRGRPELARAFVDEYVRVSGDHGVFEVLHELVRYRAMVRAKVDALGARDQAIESGERARLLEAARRHLRLLAWTA